MTIKRLWHTAWMHILKNPFRQIDYLRKHKIFACFGDYSYLQNKLIPLYPQLIRIHNNVVVGKRVEFVTHDGLYAIFNYMQKDVRVQEKVGCIEVHDNVFIGANSIVLYGVSIGPNAVVAAGSVVTKDVPPNSVVGGVPAKVIGSFDQLMEKTLADQPFYPPELRPRKQEICPELCELMWKQFDEKHKAAK